MYTGYSERCQLELSVVTLDFGRRRTIDMRQLSL